jgi:hypothetical protein
MSQPLDFRPRHCGGETCFHDHAEAAAVRDLAAASA